MKLKLFLFPVFAILAISACQSAPEVPPPANNPANRPAMSVNSANSANSVNSVNSANSVNATVNQTAAAPQALSPTDTFNALGEAVKKKDIAALRQLFNKKSLAMFAGDAKAQGKSPDEAMLNQRVITIAKTSPQIRNEKIAGDNATIEVKAAGGANWEKVYFTKEDGQWKVAMDKFMEEMIRQVEESTKSLEKGSDREDDK